MTTYEELHDACPACHADLRSGEIPRVYRAKGYYGPYEPTDPPRYYSRLIGVDTGHDRIDHWLCPDCGARWDRRTLERI